MARHLEEVITEELRMLEADEKAADHRKPAWRLEETTLGNAAVNENDNRVTRTHSQSPKSKPTTC
eukprot:4423302-Prorocentrum_lima.AAC.1